MSIAAMVNKGVSLRKALTLVGSSQGAYYYRSSSRKDRGRLRDTSMLETIRELSLRKPMYGTRMMAAVLSKELGRPVNRKLVQHGFHILGWTMPQMTKHEIIRSVGDRIQKPTGINQVWQTDMTYIWCGIDAWAYLFSVLDVFSREWIAYVFSLFAGKDYAIQSVEKALQKHPEAIGKVTLYSDNGSQYTSRAFRESMRLLGVTQRFIAYDTPEQNAFIESFHGKFKREYVWPYELGSFQEADEAISRAFVDYNTSRPHSSLGYVSPYEFLARLGVKVD